VTAIAPVPAPSTARKILALLTASERKELVVLFALMLVGMALETLGVGLVLPALALLTDTGASFRVPVLHRIVDAIGARSGESRVAGGMIALVVVYLVKNAFLTYTAWRQARFSFQLSASLSQRMFALYLGQPYAFHLRHNSARLINAISNEVFIFSIDGVGPALTLAAELLVVSALGALLISVEPAGAITVAALVAIAGTIFYRATHARATELGHARQFHEQRSLQELQQGLGAVKEILVLGRQEQFLRLFSEHNVRRAETSQYHEVLKQVPKMALEVMAMAALAGLTFAMLARGRPVSTVLPTLGLFTAVAFRIIPSANRIINGLQSIRYALPSVERLYADLSTLATRAPARAGTSVPLARAIEVTDASYTYPATNEPAVRDITLTIARGESVGIVGASGAGKSTLLDMLLGLIEPTSGTVRVDGRSIHEDPRAWQDQIGYMPQDIYLTDDTLRRNVAFGLRDEDIDEDAVWRAVRAARLESFVTVLPDGLDTLVGERGVRISGGERQRVGIARALYRDPSVLVLDEGTSSLDADTEREVVATVRALQRRKTIIIVSHRLSTIEHCDRVYHLSGGRLIQPHA
jgi:ABC-type multidrug transport system fused ATPase/permease subunit